MVTVALAGATSGFGLTMLRTFLYINKGEHKIVLLSRTEQPHFAAQDVDVRPVDYTNHAQLVQALQGVHTLISTMGGVPAALLDGQLALISAAKEAGVKRFAPSEFAASSVGGIDFYKPKAIVWEAAKNSGLECTKFTNGLFMALLAPGTPKPVTEVGIREGAKTGEEEALSGQRPLNFVLNIKAGTADLPGDGSAEMVFTDMRDIGQFVWRALGLDKWPEELAMRGDVKSYQEIIAILERVQGRKFLIRENSIEGLEKLAAESDLMIRAYNQFRIALVDGWGMVPNNLNRLFPDVTTTTCEDFIERWWGGVKLGEPSWEGNVVIDFNDERSRPSLA